MKLPLYWPPGYESNELGFDYEEFRKEIAANGHALWWQYGVPCPCRAKYTVGRSATTLYPQSAQTECPNCSGGSIFYVEGQASVGIVSGYGEKGVVSQYMLRMQPGEVFVSLPPEHRVDMDDRFTDLSISRPMSEIVRRGASAIVTPRYPIAKQPMKLGDPNALSTPVPTDVGVTYMCKSDVEGDFVSGWSGEEDVHYVITEEGKLDFSLSDADEDLNGPVEGEHLSIRYNAHPTYKVKEVVRQGRDKAVRVDDEGCTVVDIGLGPVFVILSPEYRGFRDPPTTPYNVETD